MTNAQAALQLYLIDWLAWAEAGGPDSGQITPSNPFGFRNDTGLCNQIEDYAFCDAGWELSNGDSQGLEDDIREALNEHWDCAQDYPFGKQEYVNRQKAGTQHLDPNRLAWVRKQLGRNS